MTRPDDTWIFGYGSLVWRPAIPFEESRVGYIQGYSRRFWQGSEDHRGIPGAPGRVVTLVPEPQSVVWGVAFRVPAQQLEAVLEQLDYREKGGYQRRVSPFFGNDQMEQPIDVLYYLATVENANYLGPAPMPEMAQQILSSSGPSGSNREYLRNLAQALVTLGIRDGHVSELEQNVAQLEGKLN